MFKKLFINSLSLCLILIFICTSICYAAAVTITDENLNESLQKFISSDATEDNYQISVSNNIINVTEEGKTYTLKYDLTNQPTFSIEVPIQKGMSFDEFKNETSSLLLPMLGYIAVANIQGIEMNDATAYFLFSYFENALSNASSNENAYAIVDDLNGSEGVKIEKTDNPKIIYASEFGDRVMEYTNDMYKEKQIISDSAEINSYTLTIEKLETTDTACKLVSTLKVNLDADFSKMVEYTEQMKNSQNNKDITKEDILDLNSSSNLQNTNTETTNETSDIYGGNNELSNTKKIPYAGIENNLIENILYIIIGIAVLTIVILLISNKRKK